MPADGRPSRPRCVTVKCFPRSRCTSLRAHPREDVVRRGEVVSRIECAHPLQSANPLIRVILPRWSDMSVSHCTHLRPAGRLLLDRVDVSAGSTRDFITSPGKLAGPPVVLALSFRECALVPSSSSMALGSSSSSSVDSSARARCSSDPALMSTEPGRRPARVSAPPNLSSHRCARKEITLGGAARPVVSFAAAERR